MKTKILFIFILFLLALAGCKGGGEGKSITDADVRKGIGGLVMDFTKNAPPANVYEESAFPIGINLKNKGAFDIVNGELVLGFESQYANLAKDENIPLLNIKGKSIFNLNGDEDFITLNAKTKKIGVQSETHPSTILATACYPYKTVLEASVCVDPDIYGVSKSKKACTVKDEIFQGGQGAPVTITKIETRMLPDLDENTIKPHFMIHVENKGKGEVITSGKIKDACSNEPLAYNDFNRITIKVSLSKEGNELDCNLGENIGEDDGKNYPIRLRSKKDVVRCTLKEGILRNRDAYTAPLKIELDYGYTFTISKDIIIEKILKY